MTLSKGTFTLILGCFVLAACKTLTPALQVRPEVARISNFPVMDKARDRQVAGAAPVSIFVKGVTSCRGTPKNEWLYIPLRLQTATHAKSAEVAIGITAG